MHHRRLATWIAGAVWVLSAVTALPAAGSSVAAGADAPRSTLHAAQIVVGEAVSVRPLGDRSTLDVRSDGLRTPLLGWRGAVDLAVLAFGLVLAVVAWAHVANATRLRSGRFERGPPHSLIFA